MGHSDQSPEEKHQDNKQLSNENNTIRTEGRPTEQPQNSESSDRKEKWWKRIDQSLLSTIALTIISLGALLVSIYQTRVLSLQQEVMAEQQRIMTQNAKAQAWPNIEISSASRTYNMITSKLRIDVTNTGTGPAIVENVTIRYAGKYIQSWWDLWTLGILPDSIPQTVGSVSTISDRVIQAGEQFVFLSLDNNPALMNYLYQKMRNGNGPVITVCYKSVFNDHWQLSTTLGSPEKDRAIAVDSCLSVGNTAFLH